MQVRPRSLSFDSQYSVHFDYRKLLPLHLMKIKFRAEGSYIIVLQRNGCWIQRSLSLEVY